MLHRWNALTHNALNHIDESSQNCQDLQFGRLAWSICYLS